MKRTRYVYVLRETNGKESGPRVSVSVLKDGTLTWDVAATRRSVAEAGTRARKEADAVKVWARRQGA